MLNWTVKKSNVHGNGVFATKDLKPNDTISLGIRFVKEDKTSLIYERTVFGLLINHSHEKPNTKLGKEDADWFFICSSPIKEGEEFLTNYNDYEDIMKLEGEKKVKDIIVR